MCAEKTSSSSYKIFWDAEKQASSVAYDSKNSFYTGSSRRKNTGSVVWWISLILLISLTVGLGVYFYVGYMKSNPINRPIGTSIAPQEPSSIPESIIPAEQISEERVDPVSADMDQETQDREESYPVPSASDEEAYLPQTQYGEEFCPVSAASDEEAYLPQTLPVPAASGGQEAYHSQDQDCGDSEETYLDD